MAIAYDLDLATTSTVAEVARQLTVVAKTLGLYDASATAEAVLDEGKATTRGTWILVYEEDPRPDAVEPETPARQYGFTSLRGLSSRERVQNIKRVRTMPL